MKLKLKNPPRGFSTFQKRRMALPAMLATLLLLGSLIVNGLSARQVTTNDLILLLLGISGSLYIFVIFYFIFPNDNYLQTTRWFFSAINGLALGILAYDLPAELKLIVSLFTILTVVITALIIGRGPAYLLVASCTFVVVAGSLPNLRTVLDWISMLSLPLTALIVNETILRLVDSIQETVTRLNIINEFAAQIASSLDPQQVVSILSNAIQNTLDADTYFVGLWDEKTPDEMTLTLTYDEGQFFPPSHLPLDGTLSNWMIVNRKPLLIPDLRQEPALEGVKVRTVGTERLSLSWVGVPMIAGRVLGVIVLASYRPNVFQQSDLDLLENLAQQAALALENANRHTEVETRSQQDSLTRVYNHGFFLQVLQRMADDARLNHNPISLIMLDVDLFKHYNDTYGHLIGDEVLVLLTETIRTHIKTTDAVGRWGGEEFIIALPNANGPEAMQVAERIRQTMASMMINGREKGMIPSPTVSQGIALYPNESDNIYHLIDMADQRLYVAKERGRNQIEPAAEHWDRIL